MLNATEVHKLIESEHNEKWIIKHYDELKKEYHNKWIGVKGQKVIATGINYKTFIDNLKKQCGEEFCEIVVRYFGTKYTSRILP